MNQSTIMWAGIAGALEPTSEKTIDFERVEALPYRPFDSWASYEFPSDLQGKTFKEICDQTLRWAEPKFDVEDFIRSLDPAQQEQVRREWRNLRDVLLADE